VHVGVESLLALHGAVALRSRASSSHSWLREWLREWLCKWLSEWLGPLPAHVSPSDVVESQEARGSLFSRSPSRRDGHSRRPQFCRCKISFFRHVTCFPMDQLCAQHANARLRPSHDRKHHNRRMRLSPASLELLRISQVRGHVA